MINVTIRGASRFILRRRWYRAAARYRLGVPTPPSLRRARARFRPLCDQLARLRGAP